MTHLVDTSVWHTYGRNPLVQEVVDSLANAGALFTTCPVVTAEYCFSARTTKELKVFQADMNLLYMIESDSLEPDVETIQDSLWCQGLVRAAGALDTIIAAYALGANQTLVTCDSGFVHIARALGASRTKSRLRVLHISSQGAITLAP